MIVRSVLSRALAFVLLGTMLLVGAPAPATATERISEESVDAAIERMQRFLLSQQNAETGSWETRAEYDSTHYGHTTALVTWALLKSGQTHQRPELLKALEFLAEREGGDPYTLYPRALVWSNVPASYGDNLERDAQHLMRRLNDDLEARRRSDEPINHRSLFYAVIALDAASRRGVRVPSNLWQRIAEHLLRAQQAGGGWALTDQSNANAGPMATVIALAQLHICQRHLADQPRMAAALGPAIHRGQRYLDTRLSVDSLVDSSGMTRSYEAAFHDLFLLERLSRYTGIQRYAGTNWFRTGVRTVLAREQGRGSIDGDRVETAFALLVLSQAQACIWVNELRIPGASGDHRVGELHRLTEALSRMRQRDLHWHAVDIDDPLGLWLAAPILYLSSDEPIELDEQQADRLKRYLDLGGMLVANPENGSRAFRRSIRELGERLYPDRRFEAADDEHPALGLMQPLRHMPLELLSNGVRDLILMPHRDFDIPATVGEIERDQDLMAFWYNVYAFSSERGRLTPRLFDPVPPPLEQEAEAELTVVRAMHGRQWDIEPLAWAVFSRWLTVRHPIDLRVESMPLAALASHEPPDLVHLAGVDASELSENELTALDRYLEAGGTVLVETVGGRGEFTYSLRTQLESYWDAHTLPLRPSNPLYASDPEIGLPPLPGVEVFRRYSAWYYRVPPRPRLSAIMMDERPAVLFSEEDLTLALIGSRQWGIHGYSREYAPALMRAILLRSAHVNGTALVKGEGNGRLSRSNDARE